jgi:hypothetical protein
MSDLGRVHIGSSAKCNKLIDWYVPAPIPGPNCRRRIAGHDFRGRRTVRLAAAEEDRLGFRQLMP